MVKEMEAFTDVSKLVEVFGLEKVLTFSQWEDCRQISVLIRQLELWLWVRYRERETYNIVKVPSPWEWKS